SPPLSRATRKLDHLLSVRHQNFDPGKLSPASSISSSLAAPPTIPKAQRRFLFQISLTQPLFESQIDFASRCWIPSQPHKITRACFRRHPGGDAQSCPQYQLYVPMKSTPQA
ncbi:hypothetical protein MCOR20_010393, partial [Pyricularia oryzae]